MTVPSVAIGALAIPVFSIGVADASVVILLANIFGIVPVAFFSTLGPRSGLRQIVLSRFFFGYYAVKLVAVVNALTCLGWSSINVIVGAQLLRLVIPHVAPSVSVICLAIGTLCVSFFGYHVVHNYEMVAWIPSFIVFLAILGQFVRQGEFENYHGERKAGPIFSFAASIFGFANSWATYATDYTYTLSPATSQRKIACYSSGALFFSLCFTQFFGLVISTSTIGDHSHADAFRSGGVSGLLYSISVPSMGRFGPLGVGILAGSVIGPNCMALYSLAFNGQILCPTTRQVPRAIWTILGTVICCAVAIPAYGHFETVLQTFMLTIGYWLAIYEGVALPEHLLIRKAWDYGIATYDQPRELPPGFAAVGASCFGVMGAILGMAQPWFVGPVARPISQGGDIGFILAFSFTAVT